MKLLVERIVSLLCHLINDIKVLFVTDKTFINAFITFDKYSRIEPVNWGDDINVYFIESISKTKVIPKNRSILYRYLPIKSYCCIGSVLGRFKGNNVEVWGSGLLDRNVEIDPGIVVHSVRGPLTRSVLINQGINTPEKYGDPALLLSKYYRPHIARRVHIGIIPHYADMDNLALKLFEESRGDVMIVKMRGYADWHEIIDSICSCDLVLSSSLHGLIVADAYGIPNMWVKFSDGIEGGTFKYLDYFASVGRRETSPFVIQSLDDLLRAIDDPILGATPKIDYDAIFEACPFKEKLNDFRQYEDQRNNAGMVD